MAKVKYNVKGVEAGPKEFKPLPVGMYTMQIASCKEGVSKAGNEQIVLELEVPGGEHKGRKVWDYIVLNDASLWKMRQLLEAVGIVSENGGGKESGTFDPESLEGMTVKVRIRHDSSNPDYPTSAKVGALLPMPEGETAEDYEDEEDEDYEDEDEDEDEPDDEDDEDEEDDEDDEDDEAESYEDWTIKDLVAEAKERGLKVQTRKTGAAKKRYLIVKLEKDDEADDGREPF